MSLCDHSFADHERNRLATVAVAIAVLAAAYLTAGLLAVLPPFGDASIRLAFLGLTTGIAWAGAVGALLDRPPVLIATAVALLLLGFWQAVLWVFMLPAALGLVVAGVILAHAP